MTHHPIPIDVFVREGFLQEINRRVLNPIGLSMQAPVNHAGEHCTLLVVDGRDDPEGFAYPDEHDLAPMADRVRALEDERRPARMQSFGFWIQPVRDEDEDDEARRPAPPDLAQEALDQLTRIMRTSPDHRARADAARTLIEIAAAMSPEP